MECESRFYKVMKTYGDGNLNMQKRTYRERSHNVENNVIFKSERYVNKLENQMNEVWEHFWPILGASF